MKTKLIIIGAILALIGSIAFARTGIHHKAAQALGNHCSTTQTVEAKSNGNSPEADVKMQSGCGSCGMHKSESKKDSSPAIDPICRMTVHPDKAAAKTEYKGKNYYFCNTACKYQFEKDPGKYIKEK